MDYDRFERYFFKPLFNTLPHAGLVMRDACRLHFNSYGEKEPNDIVFKAGAMAQEELDWFPTIKQMKSYIFKARPPVIKEPVLEEEVVEPPMSKEDRQYFSDGFDKLLKQMKGW